MISDDLLPLLPSLLALVDEQGVTKAAARLGISQPRMSARLASLRRLLGDPLLVAATGRRGVVPTIRALELAKTARECLDALDSAISGTTFNPREATRTFTIMANDNASLIVGLPLIEAVRAASGPDVRVVLLNLRSGAAPLARARRAGSRSGFAGSVGVNPIVDDPDGRQRPVHDCRQRTPLRYEDYA